jgi:hypothetical protein
MEFFALYIKPVRFSDSMGLYLEIPIFPPVIAFITN